VAGQLSKTVPLAFRQLTLFASAMPATVEDRSSQFSYVAVATERQDDWLLVPPAPELAMPPELAAPELLPVGVGEDPEHATSTMARSAEQSVVERNKECGADLTAGDSLDIRVV
jgi:hypothetical protein